MMLYGWLILSILAGIFVHLYIPHEVHFFWEKLPVFSALYGFIGCIIIIIISKAIGHIWLQKEENYYEKYENWQEENW
jgi:hypothetical protein